jgi:hypothetical protein
MQGIQQSASVWILEKDRDDAPRRKFSLTPQVDSRLKSRTLAHYFTESRTAL